jgi:parallel beta-helix repeat protein
MSALSIQPTFPIFTGTDGLPLENGYIWIGTANLDPQGNPISVYWDAALTIPAAQPIRTLNGYPSRSGTPARLYVNSDYSIRVMDKNGSLVYSAPQATERISSDLVTYQPPFTGGVATTVQGKLAQTISVKDFGAVGDGVTDDTTAIQAAIDYAAPIGASVFIPAGTYKITALTLPQQHGGIEIYGEAFNSMYNMENAIYRGSVLVSTQATGNIISCDGGVFYSNRGIRIRNLNIRVSTIDYAIYIKRSPELNLIENLTVYNDNVSGGSGIALESCWVGTRINGCQFNAAAIGAANIGINVFNDITAGGLSIEDTNATKFAKCIRIGDAVYQATLRNSGGEGGKYGFYVDGNDPKVLLDTCHFELNTDIAIYIEKSGGTTITNNTFYRNAESASGVKAEIYVAQGGINYNYNTEVSNCNFFGLGTNVTAIYVANPAFGSGVISNNVITAFGTGTKGLFMGNVAQLVQWTVVDNVFDAAATPYDPTQGYKNFNAGLSGNYQIRFAATPILSADPNTLDDYEEGTWTPVLGGAGGQSSQTYSNQVGHYQKIGNRVYFTFSATLTAKGSISLEAVLSGLPFSISGTVNQGAGFITDFENLGVSVSMISIVPDPNDTQYLFRRTTAAAASMSYEFGSNLFTNTTVIRGGGFYIAA